MTEHEVTTREEWLVARRALLQREKDLTRQNDELTRQRQELPWVRLEKEYEFDTVDGPKTLADLFDGRSQLLVYHFMFCPSYTTGCPTCSTIADSFNGVVVHLKARDVTMLSVSRAPLERLQAYKERMGWGFDWVSSAESDFNFDFGVSFTGEQQREAIEYNYAKVDVTPILEGNAPPAFAQLADATGTDIPGYMTEAPGLSAFALDDGAVYHTYSCYARGAEILMGYYPLLDRVPKGRNEGPDVWQRTHDAYD